MSERTIACFTIDHRSAFEYAETAQGSVMAVRLSPREDRGQRLLAFDLSIEPQACVVAFQDAFGNKCNLFNIHRRHRRAIVCSRARVETSNGTDLPDRLDASDWELLDREANDIRFWHFLAPSRFTRPSAALDAFVERLGLERRSDPLTTLRDACSILYESLRYTPGSTDVDSPIEDILETGEGVCQDYAHVMIALGRRWGFPSRYISGYLHLETGDAAREREGASHAWAEFWLPGIGWTGFDPTHNLQVDCRYIRLAEGRDYADAAPTQGAVYGGGTERLEVSVSIMDTGTGTTFAATDAASPGPDGVDPAAVGTTPPGQQ